MRYSASGAEDLFLTLVDIYTDTGSITPSIRSTIHELTQSINGKGTFRIDKLDPSIFHFTGRFFTLKRMYDLAIDVEKNHTFYELTGKYWGFTSTFDRFPNNRVLYSLEMKDGTGSTEWIHYEGKTSSKGLYLTLRV